MDDRVRVICERCDLTFTDAETFVAHFDSAHLSQTYGQYERDYRAWTETRNA